MKPSLLVACLAGSALSVGLLAAFDGQASNDVSRSEIGAVPEQAPVPPPVPDSGIPLPRADGGAPPPSPPAK